MSDGRPSPSSPIPGRVSWWEVDHISGRGVVAYRGFLADRPDLHLHHGFDGWDGEAFDTPFRPHSPGLALAEIEGLNGHVVVDVAARAGDEWDNNHGADYRLWISIDPVDSHLHVASGGQERLGLQGLEVALASAGIGRGVVSWQDNHAVDTLVGHDPRFRRLVWVKPHFIHPDEVAARLSGGYVGLKLHPSVDDYPADDPALDVYMQAAADAGATVAVHSGPGLADPARITRLASRFPTVPVVLYHTFLGLPWGRRRAIHHAHDQPNLILETSWCRSREVERMIHVLGPDRVMFGSDATVDGPHHYASRNVQGVETYKEGMVRIARHLGPDAAHKVLSENAIKLFRLNSAH